VASSQNCQWVVLNIHPACGLQANKESNMDQFVRNGVTYTVKTTQLELALAKYRDAKKVDDHLILGMIKQVGEGKMTNQIKIDALFQVAAERGLVGVE